MSEEFTGVRLFLNIPADVAHDPRLKDKSILLFGEIFSMLNVTGSFFMSNKEMAKRIRAKSERTVQKCLDELEKYGYIKRELVHDEKTGKIKGRGKITSTYCNRFMGGEQKFTGGVQSKTPRGESKCTIKEQYNKAIKKNNRSSDKSTDRVSEKQLDEDFNKLWELYPRKEGKKKAYEAYKRAIKRGVTNKEIQTGIVNYLTQIKIQGTDKKYIKQGSTWFNGNCWDDEYNVGGNSSPVNQNKTFSSAGQTTRTSDDLKREERENQIEGFMRNYTNHPEWYTDKSVKEFLADFPEMKEEVLKIERSRATRDRNTA